MTIETQPIISLDQQLEEHEALTKENAPTIFVQTRAKAISDLEQSGLVENAVHEGQAAPDFTLPDATGQAVSLSALLNQGPVVLVFYRGEWCPYCNLTLRAYQKALPQIQQLGATLIAVSPQTPDNSLTTVEKKELTFPVLSDLGNQVAREYGIVYKLDSEFDGVLTSFGVDVAKFNGDNSRELPASSTFIIDQSGLIRLAHITPDFTKRLDPTKIIEALEKIKK